MKITIENTNGYWQINGKRYGIELTELERIAFDEFFKENKL